MYEDPQQTTEERPLPRESCWTISGRIVYTTCQVSTKENSNSHFKVKYIKQSSGGPRGQFPLVALP